MKKEVDEKKEIKDIGISGLYDSIRTILAGARQRAYTAVNFAMVESYWLVGQQIVEHEQHGEARADYGKGVLKELAARLTTDFGKGFEERELRKIRQFYLTFPIRDSLRPELTLKMTMIIPHWALFSVRKRVRLL